MEERCGGQLPGGGSPTSKGQEHERRWGWGQGSSPKELLNRAVCDEDLTVCLYAGGRTDDAAGGRREKISEAKSLNEAKRRELSPNMEGWLHTELRIVSSRRKDRL